MNLNIYIYAFCRHSPKWFTKEEPKHKVHNYCIESTGTYKKKICYEKGQYFLLLISESETHILYGFITHWVKYFKPLFLEFWWLWLTDNENPKFSVSEN